MKYENTDEAIIAALSFGFRQGFRAATDTVTSLDAYEENRDINLKLLVEYMRENSSNSHTEFMDGLPSPFPYTSAKKNS